MTVYKLNQRRGVAMTEFQVFKIGNETTDIRNLDNALVAKITEDGSISIVRRGAEVIISVDLLRMMITVTHSRH
jgi:hypothetical protein